MSIDPAVPDGGSRPVPGGGAPVPPAGGTPADPQSAKARTITWAATVGLVGFGLATLIFGPPFHQSADYGDLANWFLVVLAAVGGWFALSQLRVAQKALDDQKESFAAQLTAQSSQAAAQMRALADQLGQQRTQAADEKQALADQLEVQKQALAAQNIAFERQLAVQQEQLDGQKAAFEIDSEDRRKAQAKLVFLWVNVEPDTRIHQVQHAVMATTPGLVQIVHVKNTSKQPVYDLAVNYYDGDRFHNTLNGNGWMGPDSQQDLTEPLTGGVQRYRVTLSFRDAAGVRWLLDEAGNMTR